MHTSDSEASFGCIALLIVIGFCAIFSWLAVNHRETYYVTVSNRERQCNTTSEGSSCEYVVFGTKGEFFSNSDSLWFGKWNSASIQGQINPGKTYKFETYGWRVPFLSMKPNIISAEEVKSAN